ncbi:MAG: hypothetical protein ACOYOU_09065 [Kiritimatiellia bacterium]
MNMVLAARGATEPRIGWSWTQVGRMQGVTTGVARMRHCRGLQKAPIVRVLLAETMGGDGNC